jgi:hypothetical protein
MLARLVLSRTTTIALSVLVVVISVLLALGLLSDSGSSAGHLTPARPGVSVPLLKQEERGRKLNLAPVGAETLRQRSLIDG